MTSTLRRARARLAAISATLRTRIVRSTTDLPTDGSPTRQTAHDQRRRRHSRVRLIGAAAGVVVLASAGVAVADAHKTVTLDVDGVPVQVSTFTGSVEGLLQEQDIDLGERDTVTPSGALSDGVDVVVRHARQITVETDGVESEVWTTALTADEALDMLASRGDDIRLVASRSQTDGRPDLSLDLTLDGPADVLVDGTTRTVTDGSTTVAEALDHLGVTLNDLDLVGVRTENGRVTVVVNRVVVQDVTTTSEVAFGAVEQQDSSLYVGTSKVTTAGVPGVRTVVETVTTVDGVETSRTPVSDEVTQAPVDQVTSVGSTERPTVSTSTSTSTATTATGGGDAASLNWSALAQCESGGRATAVSSNGKYYGLYQFSVSTWQAVGGTGLPSEASADEQTARAQALYNRSGSGQWPSCGSKLFS
ncbi:MAG TPA: transglycosylase family protein [Cellulomonas sp.]